jgi:polysaccharide export outer membrane protein
MTVMTNNPLARQKKKNSSLAALLLAIASLSLFSCGDIKKLQYLQGAMDSAKVADHKLPPAIIQTGDQLSIVVYSDNASATALYNQQLATGTAAGGGNATAALSTSGYLVDEDGNIQFQGIGVLHVAGLTKSQLIELLNSKLKEFLQNPYYNIRFLNFKITLVGDVAKPGLYSIPSDHINILEAVGLAGDLNITARRDNILIIREQNGKRRFGRIDLTRNDIFDSPFYQLQQNDVVYVDLSKQKVAASDQTTLRNITIATSIVSTIAIIFSVLKR